MFNFKKFLRNNPHIYVALENIDTAEDNLIQLEKYYYKLIGPLQWELWELEYIFRDVNNFNVYLEETYDC